MTVNVGYSIADISAIKSLPTSLLVNGYARLCRSTNAWFSYDSTSTVTADDISVLLPSSGTGRWLKLKANAVSDSTKLTNPMTTKGDIIVSSDNSGTPSRLAANNSTTRRYLSQYVGNITSNWTPANIATELWFSSADSSSITLLSSKVSQWLDKSGNSRHIIQSIEGNRPVINEGVQFDGSNNTLSTSSVFTIPTTNNSFFLVEKNLNGVVGAAPYSFSDTSPSSGITYQNNGGIQPFTLSGFALPYNQTVGRMLLFTQGSAVGYVNGEPTTVLSIAVGAYNNTQFSIGRRLVSDIFTSGIVYEVIIIPNSLSTVNIDRLFGYAAHLYGFQSQLRSDHPYKTTAPTITVAGTETLTTAWSELANSGVTAGSYTNANITVDSKGLVVSAVNGNTSGAVFSTTVNGLVPASGTNVNKFLKGDGTWDNQASGIIVGDPFWSNVTLLCPFETDLKNVITNSLPSVETVPPTCPNSDNQKPLGTTNSAKWTSASNSRVQFPANFYFGSSTVATFETYVYITGYSSSYIDILSGLTGASECFYFRFEESTNNFQIVLFNTSNTVYQATIPINLSTTGRLNQWLHIAITKNGHTYTLYINGMHIGTVTISTSGTIRTALSYDILGLNNSPIGYCSYFRITEGIARYSDTSSFTIPTLPYKRADVTVAIAGITNQWIGVSWSALGTSITLGSIGVSYIPTLNSLFGTTIQNLGVNSASLSPAGGGNGSVVAQIPNISSTAEIVSLECINDFRLNVPLGAISDTSTSTFYGALYTACNNILAANPNRKIILITPHGDNYQNGLYGYLTPNSTGAYYWQYTKAVRETAQRVGCYLIDISTDSGLNGAAVSTNYNVSVDGIHLNTLGAVQFANTIYKYLLNTSRLVLPASGFGTWTLSTAILGNINGTRLTPTSINGSNIIEYTAPATDFGVLWLATGANNAAKWDVQNTAQYYNIIFGDGSSGWISYGFYKSDGTMSGGTNPPPNIIFTFNSSGVYGGSRNIIAGNYTETATSYRAARVSNRIIFEALVSGTWVNVLDRAIETVNPNQITNTKIGLLVYNSFMSVSNVSVGTFV